MFNISFLIFKMSLTIIRPVKTYIQCEISNITIFKSKTLKIFTDGSYNEKIKGFGYSIVYPHNELWNFKGFNKDFKRPNNNKAELYAIYKALFLAISMFIITNSKFKSVLLYSDSLECIKGITNYYKKSIFYNRYTKKIDKETKELYKKIKNQLEVLKLLNKPVSFKFVKAHINKKKYPFIFNNIADKLAKSVLLKK